MEEIFTVTLKDCPKMDIQGILCTEAASGYWNLSSYDYYCFPVFLYHTPRNRIDRITGNISYLGVPEPLSYEDTTSIGEGIYVTNKVRTVCDMIRYESDMFHTLETVYNFYCFEDADEINILENKAEKLGILSKLHELRDTAEEDFEEL